MFRIDNGAKTLLLAASKMTVGSNRRSTQVDRKVVKPNSRLAVTLSFVLFDQTVRHLTFDDMERLTSPTEVEGFADRGVTGPCAPL
jgi:hypothetical protein